MDTTGTRQQAMPHLSTYQLFNLSTRTSTPGSSKAPRKQFALINLTDLPKAQYLLFLTFDFSLLHIADCILQIPSRYRVISASAPGMASADPFYRQPKTLERAMLLKSLQPVLRAGRQEAALWSQQGRKRPLIKPDKGNERKG